jgi:hypothetical protein
VGLESRRVVDQATSLEESGEVAGGKSWMVSNSITPSIGLRRKLFQHGGHKQLKG